MTPPDFWQGFAFAFLAAFTLIGLLLVAAVVAFWGWARRFAAFSIKQTELGHIEGEFAVSGRPEVAEPVAFVTAQPEAE